MGLEGMLVCIRRCQRGNWRCASGGLRGKLMGAWRGCSSIDRA